MGEGSFDFFFSINKVLIINHIIMKNSQAQCYICFKSGYKIINKLTQARLIPRK